MDYSSDPEHGTGFRFDHFDALDFMAAVTRAYDLYRRAEDWQALALRCMDQDFSWRPSAKRYEELYVKLLREKAPVGRPEPRRSYVFTFAPFWALAGPISKCDRTSAVAGNVGRRRPPARAFNPDSTDESYEAAPFWCAASYVRQSPLSDVDGAPFTVIGQSPARACRAFRWRRQNPLGTVAPGGDECLDEADTAPLQCGRTVHK